jgi:hypothetical protein
MRFILLVCTLATLLLSGCAVSPAKPLKVLDLEGYPISAWHSYDQTKEADYTLDIRTNVLDPKAPVIRGIKEACARGIRVSVLLYVGGRHSAPALAGTCAEIYLSDYPELQFSQIVMLLDGRILILNGNLYAANSRESQKEYIFQRHQKMVSHRIQ